MPSKKDKSPPELEKIENRGTRELPDGLVEVFVQTGFKLSGPRDTYSSVEFTHGLRRAVANDLILVAEAVTEMDAMVDALNRKRRDTAYRELLNHLNAIVQKTYYEEPK